MKKFFLVFLILVCCLPVVAPLLHQGFFVTDDGEWMVIRLTDFHRSFVSGQIPVRWGARLNYSFGYPVFNFLYPLSLYIGEVFYLLGFSAVNSIKAVFALSFFASGVSMYLLVKELWGKSAGFVSSIFYVYAPYRIVDVYTRGSLGEALSFVFIPLIFLSFVKLAKGISFKYLVLGSGSLAGLILSHNIMAFIFIPVICLFAVWQYSRKSDSKKYLAASLGVLFLGLGASAFFWLPAVYDQQFTVLSQVSISNFQQYYVNLGQLLFTLRPQTSHINSAMTIGVVHTSMLAVLAGLFLLMPKKKVRDSLFYLVVLGVSVFLVLPQSNLIWSKLPITGLIQFPWRLLAISVFATSILAGKIIFLLPKFKLFAVIAAVLAVIGLNYSFVKPNFISKDDSFYSTNEATTTVRDEYMPKWVKVKPTSRADNRLEFISGGGEITNLTANSRRTTAQVRASKDSTLQFNGLYFPGWKVYTDNKEISIDYQNDYGLIRFSLPEGVQSVFVVFGETTIRLLADLLSLVSIVVLIFLLKPADEKYT